MIDPQEIFLDPSSRLAVHQAAALRSRLIHLARSAMNNEIPIILTRHVHAEHEDSYPFNAIWDHLILDSSPGSDIIPELKALNIPTIEKSTYSAFTRTSLEQTFRRQGVTVLALAGVTSHLCVETTARHALTLGFFPVVLYDGVGSWSLEQHHRSMRAIADGVGAVVLHCGGGIWTT